MNESLKWHDRNGRMRRHDRESNKFGNKIAEQAALSFDFIALLTIASILAGIGLITDNSIVVANYGTCAR
jgi:response regulator RpfG family c-di-GMP phosphodiesterase